MNQINSIEIHKKHKNKLLALLLIFIGLFLLGYILIRFVLPLSFFIRGISNSLTEAENKIATANYPEVLKASRYIMENLKYYQDIIKQDYNDSNKTYDLDIDKHLTDERIPKIFREIKPLYLLIDSTHVVIVFMGGFEHRALIAYRNNNDGYGTKQLIPGLWLKTDEEQR